MKVILSGFSQRDGLVFDMFLKRSLPTWRWQSVPPGRDSAFPEADLLIVDLAACGWAQYSELAQARLMAATAGQVAILLVSAQDRSWSQKLPADQHTLWIWLAKPYGSQGMLRALKQAEVLCQNRRAPSQDQNSVPMGVGTSLARQTQQPEAEQGVAAVSPAPTGQQVKPQVPAVSAPVPEFSLVELAARLDRLPVDRFLLLRKLLTGLRQKQPFEIRFTVQHFLIVHPVDGWVASNTPIKVIMQVCTSDTLARSVSVREMTVDQTEARLLQLGMTPQELNAFLLDIVTATLPPSINMDTGS